ncbi:MAG: M10 family metallopeptidase C-terminal domain-containing protein, partial [Pseudomonadota bacterium]
MQEDPDHICGPHCDCGNHDHEVDENGLHFHAPHHLYRDDVTVAEIEAAENSLNKPDFSLDQAAAQITRSNIKWNDSSGGNELGTPGSVTYSYSANPDTDNAQANAAMIAMTERAIQAIADVANIDFTRVGSGTSGSSAYSDVADINIEAIPNNGGGYASYYYYLGSGSNLNEFGEVTVGLGATAGYSQDQDYGMTVALHEVAHAVGLSHPGNYNGSGATNYTDQAEYFQDSRQFSLMSYWSESNTGADFFARAWTGSGYEWVGGYSTNLMLHDIAALHRLYGANTQTRNGDTVYGFNSNTGDSTWELSSASDSIIAAVWDAGGNDTLDLSGFYESANVDLRQETFSSFGGLTNNFAIAKGAEIENAIGGFGNDTLLGNELANSLFGGEGDDTLIGGAGNDVLLGGTGADVLNGGEGIDRVQYSDSTAGIKIDLRNPNENTGIAQGDTYVSIENVLGSKHNDVISGDGENNQIWGWFGDDILFGREGDDKLGGGQGNDVLLGGAGADVLNGGDGIDLAQYSDSTTGIKVDLRNPSENTGIAEGDIYLSIENVLGSKHNDIISGDNQSNEIWGWFGDDILFGKGGNDKLGGGQGNDVLLGGAGADVLNGGDGIDLAQYSDSTTGIMVDLLNSNENTGIAEGDTYLSIENVLGSKHNDIISGDNKSNEL